MRKILTLLLMTLSTAAAASCCDLDGCFEVGGEALYWKPTGADFQYARTLDINAQQSDRNRRVVGDYDWGFRVFGSYHSDDCCNFMTLDWTYLRTTDADSVSVSGADEGLITWVFSVLFEETTVTARLRFDYDKVNLRFGRYLFSGCSSRLFAYGGARFVKVEQKQRFFADGFFRTEGLESITYSFSERSCFEGGGLEVGFGGVYELWCDLNLVANFGLTAEVGELKQHCDKDFFIGGNPQDTNIDIRSRTICVPGAELRLGLDYTYKCDCVWITGELGYQMDYRWNALGLFEGQPIDSIPTSKRTSVGFGGLYFGLSARF